MASKSQTSVAVQLGQSVRQAFLQEIGKVMDAVADDVQEQLTQLVDQPAPNSAEMTMRREVWMAFRSARPLWVDGVRNAWVQLMQPQGTPEPDARKLPENPLDIAGLELVGTDEVEFQIQASRMVQVALDRVSVELDDLRIRIKQLEGIEELSEKDPFQPQLLISKMVGQWADCGMSAGSWALVADTVQKRLMDGLNTAYAHANDTLVDSDILPVISLKDRVKAPEIRPSAPQRPVAEAPATATYPTSFGEGSGAGEAGLGGAQPAQRTQPAMFGGRLGWGGAAPTDAAPMGQPVHQDFAAQTAALARGASDETRLMTASTPLQQSQARAQGVAGQIRRIFVSRVGNDPAAAGYRHQPPSAGLARAMAQHMPQPQASTVSGTVTDTLVTPGGDTMVYDYSPAGVARVASNLRERTAELKGKAETKNEKATIEIVALMFQAILAEERIPPNIRVWFARLQMPVLRLALEDSEFFSTTDHPARLLIDRMGSCVMGFDASGVQVPAMEAEVKRIVQIVEQYPETGKKVYQIVYAEFQKFLAKFLTQKEQTQKVVSIAQQVEQKETLAIQYTIEMRNMLKDMPVRDAVRDFLFKVWAEVLAVSALRNGAKHADTLTLKKSATDLLWAASSKPGRQERARVIQDLPHLLARLRSGMTLLGLPTAEQEKHVKAISDTLADAFLSKTHVISQARIDAMAQRLSELEDFVSADGLGDLPLDAESLEMMMGLEAGTIDVIANGGSKPSAAMLAWAQELHLGSWFTLDHNGQVTQVQLVWRSEHKQLNLFAATTGKTYLLQSGRLGAYLQAGLLVPQEDEALTVRATRDAIAKIEANPERLLS